MIEIYKINDSKVLTKEDLKALKNLISQLSARRINIRTAIIEFLNQEGRYLFVYRDNDSKMIVGISTIYFVSTLTSNRGVINDVVVDINQRGKGIGRILLESMIQFAKEYRTGWQYARVSNIDLTSNPSRVAANNLYQKLGFQKRETNVYRLNIK